MIYKGYALVVTEVEADNEEQAREKIADKLGDDYFSWFDPNEIMLDDKNGIPLANDSEKAKVQAYFDGQAYGWEQGRKALIDDVKAKIKLMDYHMIDCDVLVSQDEVLDIIEKYKEGDKE